VADCFFCWKLYLAGNHALLEIVASLEIGRLTGNRALLEFVASREICRLAGNYALLEIAPYWKSRLAGNRALLEIAPCWKSHLAESCCLAGNLLRVENRVEADSDT